VERRACLRPLGERWKGENHQTMGEIIVGPGLSRAAEARVLHWIVFERAMTLVWLLDMGNEVHRFVSVCPP
jgi:hypothetical protein